MQLLIFFIFRLTTAVNVWLLNNSGLIFAVFSVYSEISDTSSNKCDFIVIEIAEVKIAIIRFIRLEDVYNTRTSFYKCVTLYGIKNIMKVLCIHNIPFSNYHPYFPILFLLYHHFCHFHLLC